MDRDVVKHQMSAAIDDFYSQVPVFDSFDRFTDPTLYRPLPDDWVIAVSDVVSSTEAIHAGQYKNVNVAGAAAIAAVSNALGHRDFAFTFGGDGATLALTLRVALVPVAAIRAGGWDVQVGRYAPSPHVNYAMFTGGGIAWAVGEMKAGAYAVQPAPTGTRPDLTGLSCRWQEFPTRLGVIVSLIAVPITTSSQSAFRDL